MNRAGALLNKRRSPSCAGMPTRMTSKRGIIGNFTNWMRQSSMRISDNSNTRRLAALWARNKKVACHDEPSSNSSSPLFNLKNRPRDDGETVETL